MGSSGFAMRYFTVDTPDEVLRLLCSLADADDADEVVIEAAIVLLMRRADERRVEDLDRQSACCSSTGSTRLS